MDARGDLLPHRPPWLLVDRVVSRDEGRIECEKRLAPTDPLLYAGELPEILVVEALAQTAACLNTGDIGRHRGMLVAATRFEFSGRARAGDTLRLVATKEAALGALIRFAGVAYVGDRAIATGQMTFAVEASA